MILVVSSEFSLSCQLECLPMTSLCAWDSQSVSAGFERECPQSEHPKRPKWELQAILRFISEIPEYQSCIPLIKQVIKAGPDSRGGELDSLM